MKNLFLLVILFASLAEGCKKYEEGPLLSLRSAENRLHGDYTLTTYTVNGVDSLSLYNDSLYNILRFYFDDFMDLNICCINGNRKDGELSFLKWYWGLKDNNTKLLVTYSECLSGTVPFKHKVTPEWEIIKLKKGDIRMRTILNGKEYYIELNGN